MTRDNEYACGSVLFWFIVTLFLLSIVAGPVHCAISNNTVWEVRTVGADTNGGGFVTGASGTDYSQNNNKNAASCTNCGSATVDLSTTDAVAAGTTTITSATANFSTAIVGNIVFFSGGTGSIAAQWRQVTARASTTSITIDATIAVSTGMTMNIGGALLTVAQATTNTIAGNTTWIKAGTYSRTTTMTVANLDASAQTQPTSWNGYNATRGDASTRPVLTSATNSIAIFSFSGGRDFVINNIDFTHTAATRGNCLHAKNTAVVNGLTVTHSTFDGCLSAVYGEFAVDWTFNQLVVDNSEIKNSTSHGVFNDGQFSIINSYIHNNAGDGVRKPTSASGTGLDARLGWFVVEHSILYSNTSSGLRIIASPVNFIVQNSAFVSNGADGITQTTAGGDVQGIWQNNIFESNTTTGVNFAAASSSMSIIRSNFYFGNGTARTNFAAGAGDVTGTASAFVAPASNNFALNSTAGGGTACKQVGFPGALLLGGTGYLDIGPLQSQGTGGGSTGRTGFCRISQ